MFHITACRPKHEEYVPMPNWLTILHWFIYSNSYCTCSYVCCTCLGRRNQATCIATCKWHNAVAHMCGYPLQTFLNLILIISNWMQLYMGLTGETSQYWTCKYVCIWQLCAHVCVTLPWACTYMLGLSHYSLLTPSNTVFRELFYITVVIWWHHITWLDLEVVIGLHP